VRNNTSKGETFVSKNSMMRNITILFVLVISVALVSADLIVSAQNSNSSTTQSDEQTRGGMMTSQNGNMSNTESPRRRRRPRRRGMRRSNANTSGDMSNSNMSTDASDNANTSGDMQNNTNMAGDASGNANMSGDMSGGTSSGGGGRRRRRGRRGGNAAMTTDTSGATQTGTTERTDGGMQEDLAGQSYTGTVNYSEGSLSGPATLAFESGGQFTLTPDGGTAMSGRYSAVTTRGYTGVTMMFSGATPPAIVSVRLKKMGNGVSIMSVPGENRQFSFTSSGGGGMMSSGGGSRRPRRKRRGRRGIKPPMAAPADTTQSPTQ
jgi:hypothetical protein